MIYLDNNATTIMPIIVKKAMLEWCNRGNPSAGYASANESKQMMADFRTLLSKLCGLGSDTNYKIIFTSGASEANCMALQCIVSAWTEIANSTPHIIISDIEHKSIHNMAKSYEARGLTHVSYIKPTASGHIRPEDVQAQIRPETCLIAVMHANNETGAINDIKAIGALAHQHNIPFHCDTVQTFGKTPISPTKENVDSMSVSFHKFHGPPGVGVLIIRQKLLAGYKIQPMIFGTQNDGLRGGTENLPGIGAAFAATKYAMSDRLIKNATVGKLKKYIIKELSNAVPARSYTQYVTNHVSPTDLEIVFLSGDTSYYLSNTILLSIVKHTTPAICNAKIKNELEKKGIVVSVGSACNTASPVASHVLFAMDADELIRKGALRITLGDENTMQDAKKFVQVFLSLIKQYTSNVQLSKK